MYPAMIVKYSLKILKKIPLSFFLKDTTTMKSHFKLPLVLILCVSDSSDPLLSSTLKVNEDYST